MKRLIAAIHTDLILQMRNYLYVISAGISLLLAAALIWLSSPDQLQFTIPMGVLFTVGGSTLLYVVSMIILENDDGILDAIKVSPLRPQEYLASKVITLTILSLFEGVLLCGVTVGWFHQNDAISWPGVWQILLGLVALGAMHTLIGIILVVRHHRLLDALLPMSGLATLLQIPAFYFIGALDHPLVLFIPSAAPSMFIKAAFTPISTGEWIYAFSYTAVSLALLGWWAKAAFSRHVVHGGAS